MKPVVFISAVSSGLWPYREMVAKMVKAQGLEPDEQGSFTMPQNHILEEIKGKICDCKFLIGLVGPFYGGEPEGVFKERTSYTQFEVKYALKHKKQCLLFFTNSNFRPELNPDGEIPNESDEKLRLQQRFITSLKSEMRGIGRGDFGDREELALNLARIRWSDWL